MGNTNEMSGLTDRKYFSTGQLHFLRSESDLHTVIVNTMQSAGVLIQLLNKHKEKYLGGMKVEIRWVAGLERAVSKLLRAITGMYHVLEAKEKMCVSGFCVAMECIDVIMAKTTVLLIQLQLKYSKKLIVRLIGQVNL